MITSEIGIDSDITQHFECKCPFCHNNIRSPISGGLLDYEQAFKDMQIENHEMHKFYQDEMSKLAKKVMILEEILKGDVG